MGFFLFLPFVSFSQPRSNSAKLSLQPPLGKDAVFLSKSVLLRQFACLLLLSPHFVKRIPFARRSGCPPLAEVPVGEPSAGLLVPFFYPAFFRFFPNSFHTTYRFHTFPDWRPFRWAVRPTLTAWPFYSPTYNWYPLGRMPEGVLLPGGDIPYTPCEVRDFMNWYRT